MMSEWKRGEHPVWKQKGLYLRKENGVPLYSDILEERNNGLGAQLIEYTGPHFSRMIASIHPKAADPDLTKTTMREIMWHLDIQPMPNQADLDWLFGKHTKAAYEDALDIITRMCGAKDWDYPGQVINLVAGKIGLGVKDFTKDR